MEIKALCGKNHEAVKCPGKTNARASGRSMRETAPTNAPRGIGTDGASLS